MGHFGGECVNFGLIGSGRPSVARAQPGDLDRPELGRQPPQWRTEPAICVSRLRTPPWGRASSPGPSPIDGVVGGRHKRKPSSSAISSACVPFSGTRGANDAGSLRGLQERTTLPHVRGRRSPRIPWLAKDAA